MKLKLILLVIVLNCMQIPVWAGVRYHVKNLSRMAAESEIVPMTGNSINRHGDVSGYGYPTAEWSDSKAFLYVESNDQFINLGNLAGSFIAGKGGNGYGINDDGVVVGRNSIDDESWDYRPFRFQDANGNGQVDEGEMVNLGTEDDHYTGLAFSINEQGQVVGYSSNDALGGWIWTDKNLDGDFDNGEKQYFHDLTPVWINDESEILLKGYREAYLWTDENEDGDYSEGERFVIANPAEGYWDGSLGLQVTIQYISAVSMNNDGVVCGAAENYFGIANGFYWVDGNSDHAAQEDEFVFIGSALRYTHVRAMNNHSVIVGGSYEYGKDRRAFVWDQTNGMRNLNDLAWHEEEDRGRIWFTQAEGINDKGQIVTNGWYDIDNNNDRTSADPMQVFVLTPYYEGDLNQDGRVGLDDFVVFSNHYMQRDVGRIFGDINEDDSVDMNDLLILVDDWLRGLAYE